MSAFMQADTFTVCLQTGRKHVCEKGRKHVCKRVYGSHRVVYRVINMCMKPGFDSKNVGYIRYINRKVSELGHR